MGDRVICVIPKEGELTGKVEEVDGKSITIMLSDGRKKKYDIELALKKNTIQKINS